VKLKTFDEAFAAMDKIEATTDVASNKTEKVVIDMVGECVGAYVDPDGNSTAVRKTTCGKFAVIAAKPRRNGSYRLIKTFAGKDHARN
jgi:hypothetical protein